MYMEVGLQHHSPHFHAYAGDDVAIYSLETLTIIAGSLPRRQQRLVEAWAELHQEELAANWLRLQSGQPAQPIAPLA